MEEAIPFALLLSMQAAGMITDYFGVKNQSTLMNLGMKAQQAGIEANIAQTRLATQDDSVQAMKELRRTLGSQIAVFAARGTSTSSGSALGILNESVGNFNADERTRRLNALGKINQLRSGAALSTLQNSSDVSKLWQGFTSRSINKFPTSLSGWNQLGTDASEGFGLTKIWS